MVFDTVMRRQLTAMRREGQRLRPVQAQGQGRPRRQHRQQVRFHPSVRRPREALQGYAPSSPPLLPSHFTQRISLIHSPHRTQGRPPQRC